MRAREYFPWCQEELRAGRIVVIPSMKMLPTEAARDLEVYRHFGVKSNLTIPLSTGGKPAIGCLGFNTTGAERDWPDALVERLQLIPQIFANALARKRADQELRETAEVNRATFEQAAVGIAHVGIDGRWLRVNDKLCAIVGYPREELLQLTFQDITSCRSLGSGRWPGGGAGTLDLLAWVLFTLPTALAACRLTPCGLGRRLQPRPG